MSNIFNIINLFNEIKLLSMNICRLIGSSFIALLKENIQQESIIFLKNKQIITDERGEMFD